ncbi:MAG: NUDIX hydrolase, partial [bacterium]
MSQFNIIKSEEIEKALSETSRQYLAGNLALPQIIKHVHSKELEIGISDYEGGEFEEAHFHPKQTEYQLILWGETEYYDLTNNKTHRFKKGDFYCTESNVKYAQKILEKTRIFFIKIPAVNDKTLCKMSG